MRAQPARRPGTAVASRSAVRKLCVLIAVAGCGGREVAFAPGEGAWPSPPALPFAGVARVATADIADDTLGFVSLDVPTPKALGVEPIGDNPVEIEAPHDLKVSPDGEYLYVVLSNYAPGSGTGPHGAHGLGTVPGSLIKLRARDLARVAEVELDRNAAELDLSSDGKTAYVTHYDLLRLERQQQLGLPEGEAYATVAIVDTTTMAKPPLVTVCATPHDLGLSPDEKSLYVTCSNSDELAIVDLATRAVARVPVGPAPGPLGAPRYFPYALEVSPLDGTVWIACQRTAELRVYDPRTGAMDPAPRAAVAGVPMFGDFVDGGRTFVVPHQGDDKLSYLDVASGAETATLGLPAAACLNVRNLLVLDDGTTAYLTCEGDRVKTPGTVVVLDLAAHAALGWAPVGVDPNAIELLPPAP